MGTIKRVTRADYSANAVGKYDFDSNIFRRKINGKLERNYLALNKGTSNGFVPLDLSSNMYVARCSFIYAVQSGSHKVFSFADYNAKRSFVLVHTKTGDGKIMFQLVIYIDTRAYSLSYTYGVAPTELTDYEFEISIDFVNKKFAYFKINGVLMALPAIAGSDNPTAWTNGQSRTVCFGHTANYTNDPLNASSAYPYFGQLTDDQGNILFHYDMLGDNQSEILTDKARLDRLVRSSEVLIISKPIDL